MNNTESLNALKAIARRCNEELKPIDRRDLKAMAAITRKYGEQAKLIGFSHTHMMVEIGYLNKALTDRSMQ